MTGIMAGATCPIHFVLTKWDLIRGFGEPVDADDNVRLGLIRDALMNAPQLRALVDPHTFGDRIIRLIPVSAVGPELAQMGNDGAARLPAQRPVTAVYGWNFLVARGRQKGYQTLLAPDFLAESNEYGGLGELTGGDVEPPRPERSRSPSSRRPRPARWPSPRSWSSTSPTPPTRNATTP